MAKLNAYLFFNGKAQEAMNFYKDVFGGELDIQFVNASPVAVAHMPADMHDKVMHSVLKTEKFSFMASDMVGGDGAIHGNTLSLCLDCDSPEEQKALYAKLSEGGSADHPLKEEAWGIFGDCTDKYGFRWMLNFTKKNA